MSPDPWPGILTERHKPSAYDVPYKTPDPFAGPSGVYVDWRMVELWEQENPRPPMKDDDGQPIDGAHEAWEEWYSQYSLERDRAWVAVGFPQFNVWEWAEGDVRLARRICARHVCSACGRIEDPGCVYGC